MCVCMCVYVLHKQEEDGEHDLEVANFKLLQPRGTQGQNRGNWEPGMDGKVRRQQPVHCLPPSLPCQGPGGSIRKLKCWWEELGHLDACLKGGPSVYR